MKEIFSVVEGKDRVPVSFDYKGKNYIVKEGYCLRIGRKESGGL